MAYIVGAEVAGCRMVLI